MSMKKKTISRTETAVSLTILGVLLAVAGGVFGVQYRMNPALRVLTAPLPLPQSREQEPAGESSKGPFVPLPEGLTPLTPPETFDAGSLSDKIDGKAELYLSAGFQELRTGRFSAVENPDLWLELYVYDMGSEQNAFSVFSLQRREGASPLQVTSHSYQTENGLFLVHGRYYVEVIGSSPSVGLRAWARSVAENFAAHTPVEGDVFEAEHLFPGENLDPESLTLLSTDAFGFQGLDRVYTAAYRMKGETVTAFLSRRSNEAAAAELADAYYRFLLENGGRPLTDSGGVPGARMVDILGGIEVIFSRGRYFAGIHDAARLEAAEEAAALLNRRLQEDAHGN